MSESACVFGHIQQHANAKVECAIRPLLHSAADPMLSESVMQMYDLTEDTVSSPKTLGSKRFYLR